ncbi:hypothetical protein [Cohnella nanjingensis]|uniref:hypothetical protein n=1 Tax=Cohnella nanjingensis TaxID=1387779 RepID=UPI001FE9D0C5|nr:hypothetical protein [Cohnella nanjingensis]
MRGAAASVEARGVELAADGSLVPIASVAVIADAFVPRDRNYYIRVFEALVALTASDCEAL